VALANSLVDLALKYKEEGNKYVVGIDFSGDPRVGKFEEFMEPLMRARE
jgi:hypothetical protein